jgi:hypothetical protein
MSEQEDVKLKLAELAAVFGTVQRKREELKPGVVLEVTKDHSNPHALRLDGNVSTRLTVSLVVIAEIQPEFVTTYWDHRRGTCIRAMRFEERVLVLDQHGNPRLLSEFETWKLFSCDADA